MRGPFGLCHVWNLPIRIPSEFACNLLFARLPVAPKPKLPEVGWKLRFLLSIGWHTAKNAQSHNEWNPRNRLGLVRSCLKWLRILKPQWKQTNLRVEKSCLCNSYYGPGLLKTLCAGLSDLSSLIEHFHCHFMNEELRHWSFKMRLLQGPGLVIWRPTSMSGCLGPHNLPH